MTLWNLIRDFLVINIFGGHTSSMADYTDNMLGLFYHSQSLDSGGISTGDLMVNVGNVSDFANDIAYNQISLGDWLSSTFTIITLVLLVIFLYIFVKWIFKLFSGLLH